MYELSVQSMWKICLHVLMVKFTLNKLCTYPIVRIKTNIYFVVFKYTLDMCYTTDNLLSVSVPHVALLP